jgi:hypothetical protein
MGFSAFGVDLEALQEPYAGAKGRDRWIHAATEPEEGVRERAVDVRVATSPHEFPKGPWIAARARGRG